MKGPSPSRASGSEVARHRSAMMVMLSSINYLEGEIMKIITLRIDLAKNAFAVHGVDEFGKAALARPGVKHDQLLEPVATLPPCVIGMEACSGAHQWARAFAGFGHTPKLVAPKFIAPCSMSGRRGKNDAAMRRRSAKPSSGPTCGLCRSRTSISKACCACTGSARDSSKNAPPPSIASAACTLSSVSCWH